MRGMNRSESKSGRKVSIFNLFLAHTYYNIYPEGYRVQQNEQTHFTPLRPTVPGI